MTTAIDTRCPRCSGFLFRDYDDRWCLNCGPLYTPCPQLALEVPAYVPKEVPAGYRACRACGKVLSVQGLHTHERTCGKPHLDKCDQCGQRFKRRRHRQPDARYTGLQFCGRPCYLDYYRGRSKS